MSKCKGVVIKLAL